MELVEIQNEQVVTSSLEVAKHFNKRHNNVMRDIENLIGGLLKIEHTRPTEMFYLDNYTNEQNGQQYLQYIMNRDGFNLLVMGFTGEEALEWKVKYINAFNEMEKSLKNKSLSISPNNRIRDKVQLMKKAIDDILELSDIFLEKFQCGYHLAMASATEFICEEYGINSKHFQLMLPTKSDAGFLNATALAKELGMLNKNNRPDARSINLLLKAHGLIDKIDGKWCLTNKGNLYGENKPFFNHGHSGYSIIWSKEVLNVLR